MGNEEIREVRGSKRAPTTTVRFPIFWFCALFALLLSACGGGGGESGGESAANTGTAIAPSIIVEPQDVASIEGQQVTMSVTASGTNLSYRWQRSSDGVNWLDVQGANSSSLALISAKEDLNVEFRAVVSNGAGSKTSRTARLKVEMAAAPVFTLNPVDTAVTAGNPVTFASGAVGSPLPSTRWQESSDGGATWIDIPSASGSHFTISQTSPAHDGKFLRAVATNAKGDVFSAAALLRVQSSAAPSIENQPVDVAVSQGMTASFAVVASGVPSVSYQWQVSVDGGATFTNITSGNGSTLRLSNLSSVDHLKRYRVLVSNSVSTVASAIATLSVVEVPTITLQPANGTWFPGRTDGYFTAAATGGGNTTLQWQVSSDDGATWTNATNGTGRSYVHPANASLSVNRVRVLASNASGTIASQSAMLQALRWEFTNPRPTGFGLSSTTWVDATTVLAVGTRGTILRSTDAGITWSTVSEDASSSGPLRGIAFDRTGTGITTTGSGAGNLPIKRTIDGGGHWTQVNMPATNGLDAVAFSNTGAFCLAGKGGTILRSTNGGLDWTPAVSDGGTVSLKSMAFNQEGVGLIVGAGGTVLRSINGGANWSRVSGTGTQDLETVTFATKDIAFAGGANGTLLRTLNGGLTWQVVTSGTTALISSIHFGNGSIGAMILSPGDVRITTDGGSSWTSPATYPSGSMVSSLQFGPNASVVAVGGFGSILRSVDGGINWTAVSSEGQGSSLNSVSFSTSSSGVAVGGGGRVLRSVDGGRNWLSTSSGTTSQLNAVGFFNATTGVAVGVDGAIVRTTNGGGSWLPVPSGTNSYISAFAAASNSVGYAAAGPALLRTSDAGASWSPVASSTPGVRGLAFANAQVGLAVGDAGAIYRTTDGGQSWSTMTSGTQHTLFSVAFASPTNAVAVGTNGVVLRSLDAGATWQVGVFPFYSDYWFYGVAFLSPSTGLAVGMYGTVMVTRDGGTTWAPDISLQEGGMAGVAALGSGAAVTVGAWSAIMRVESF